MKTSLKNWYSPILLVGAVLSYLFITDRYNPTDTTYSLLFDELVWKLTWSKWATASLDIGYYVALGIPLVLLALSVAYGIKTLRDKELSRVARLFSIVWITLSAGLLAVGAISIWMAYAA